MVSLTKEGIFDHSVKGTKEQAMGQVDSFPGWGAVRAKALGQEEGQQAD